jgi:hypothetical protein
MAVSRTLDAASLMPTQLEIRKPTLDDVFLKITGNGKSASTAVGGES